MALRFVVRAFLTAITLSGSAAITSAQQPTKLDLGAGYNAGNDAEQYWRAAQLAGLARPTSWAFSPLPSELGRAGDWLADHPWSSRFTSDTERGWWSVHPLRSSAKLIFNSSFPTVGDGPAWVGRGFNGILQSGFNASAGRLHLQVAPVLFLAQNQPFSLAVNGESAGNGPFRDARFPEFIDAPQRFGTGAYGRLDAGTTTLSVDLPVVAAGLSTAPQSWGPARAFPLILSDNAGGFAHAFVGTRQPLNLKLFTLHARVLAGTLRQSPYSPIDTGPNKRWASALIIAISPRGIRGLELGFSRFIEAALPSGYFDFSKVSRVFTGAQINGADNIESENQLAAAFFRWAFPGAGFELYGEYAREDYSHDVRRFIQYPDDLRSYVFGFERAVQRDSKRLRSYGVEIVNAEISSSNRGERGDIDQRILHGPFPPYLHNVVRQGHTNNGLFLGSPEAYGGAAIRATVDQFTAKGRTSFRLERSLRLDWLPPADTAQYSSAQPDVIWSARAERMRFAGKRDYTFSLTAMLETNRNLVQKNTVFNMRAAVSVRGLKK